LKTLFLIALFYSTSLFGISIDGQIKQNQKKLGAKKIEYQKMDSELSTVAKKIMSAKTEQNLLNNKLSSLEITIKNSEAEYKQLKENEEKVSKDLTLLGQDIELKKNKFVALVAEKFSMALALEELNQPTSESVVLQEIYGIYAKKNDQELAELSKEIEHLEGKKSTLNVQQNNIKSAITQYVVERQEYQVKKDAKDKILASLARDEAIYKKRFDSINSSRKSLERKLAQLNIIKRDAIESAKAKKIEAQNQANATIIASRKDTKLRVSRPQITTYNGNKTISPLEGSRLIKKFGTYIDPIYKFKIFNKSITLKAPYAGAKVKNVLSGKVVFAENSGGMLGKVVIIEHSNNIHTIYAQLSRLAPGVHVGKHLTGGSVIGKVESSLMFEVTKNNKHMDPLNLISL